MTDLTFTRTQQFTAQGAASVNWSVDGVLGGNSSIGTITSAGLYTPPASVGTHTVTATTSDQSQSGSATVYVTNYAGTFTYHNDVGRTGENLNELALTPANVNQSTFGKLFSYPLDGLTFASPLYVANVNIPGKGFHNVVYVATEHDSVYAFDADGLSSTPLWHDSFINPANGITTVPAADTGETGDIPNEIGITSTPVIDPTTGTLYVDAATKEVSGGTTTYVHKLHAARHRYRRREVRQSRHDSGERSRHRDGLARRDTLTFVPLRENQRTALLLSNGVVYLGFSSRGDHEPFHGWVLGYNATTLQQVMVYCTTPNGDDGGVWMSGDGVAADSAGSLYFITGDGLFDASSGGTDYGDSFVKMNAAGSVLDYFSPQVQSSLNSGNLDLGSGGPLLLPDQPGAHPHEMVGAGKNGTIYLVDRDNMGHFHSNSDQIVQSIVNIWTNVTGGRRRGRALRRARLFQRQPLLQPARGHGAGLPAEQRAADDHADLAVGGDVRRDDEHVRLARRNPGDLRQRNHERDPLGTREQGRHCSRRPSRVRCHQPRQRALQQQPGRLARRARSLAEVHHSHRRQRSRLRRLRRPTHRLRPAAVSDPIKC